jgi:membrane protein YdbS with pleckstrin-like domain
VTLRFYIHFLPFATKKLGFWVQKGKIWNFSKFSILLLSEALVALLCFPKGWKMFVSREDLQTIILSTERPLYHVGELRYGPPKFFEENQKF